jgi:hypothetical protein
VLETLNTQPKAPAKGPTGVTAGGKGSDFMSNAGEPVQGGSDSAGEPPVSDYTKPRPQTSGEAQPPGGKVEVPRKLDFTKPRETPEQAAARESVAQKQGEKSEKFPVNWKSQRQFGHTFKEHGQSRLKNLQDRAADLRNPSEQGIWNDNQKAAEFLAKYLNLSKVTDIDIPDGLGRYIKKDRSIMSAKYARIVPNPEGGIKTAFPISAKAYE